MNTLGRLFTYATLALCVALSGCTSRGLTVTSEPPGAEVSINRRIVGKTPIRVTFNHYGTYRIELRKDGYKVMVKEEPVRPPIYGYDPVAAVADNVIPARLNDEVYLHYALKSLELKDDKDSLSERESLLDRAFAARNGTVTHPQTGEIVQVKLDRIPPSTPGEAVAVADEEDIIAPRRNISSAASGETPLIAPPTDTIQDTPSLAKPKEASLAKELGIEATATVPGAPKAESRGTFVSPEAAKPERPKVVRIPKEEFLIYQAPKIEKKDEKEKKSEDAAPPEPQGPRPPEAKKTASN